MYVNFVQISCSEKFIKIPNIISKKTHIMTPLTEVLHSFITVHRITSPPHLAKYKGALGLAELGPVGLQSMV